MLFAALVLTLAAEPPRESALSVFATSLSGASFQVSAPGEDKGLVVGARFGLHASRPPVVNGGSRLGLLPTLTLRHDFGSTRTEWTGSVALSVELWKLRILSGIGYGLTMKPDFSAPQPLLELSAGAGFRLGAFWVGLQLDTFMRLGTNSRSLHATLQIGIEWDLLRESFE